VSKYCGKGETLKALATGNNLSGSANVPSSVSFSNCQEMQLVLYSPDLPTSVSCVARYEVHLSCVREEVRAKRKRDLRNLLNISLIINKYNK
jgi:hypothetical protein